jgi:membrane protease YdiL (CAAX protease family)
METKKIDLKQLITSIMAVIAIEIAFGLMMSESRFHPMVILGLTRMVQISMIFLIVSARGKGLSSIGMEPSEIFHGFKRGLIWSTAFGFLVAIGCVVLLIFKIELHTLIRSSLPKDKGAIILFFIVGGVLAPVAEEIFFRGILYGFLRRWGLAISLFLSASIFALAHIAVSGAFFIPLIGGILFAASYEVEKSLLAPITIHILGNLAIFTISLWS